MSRLRPLLGMHRRHRLRGELVALPLLHQPLRPLPLLHLALLWLPLLFLALLMVAPVGRLLLEGLGAGLAQGGVQGVVQVLDGDTLAGNTLAGAEAARGQATWTVAGLGGRFQAWSDAWLGVWQDDHLRWRIVWSFLQAAFTCGLALLLGLPCAWVLARLEFAGRAALLRLLMLPFVVPTLVAALGVLALWGPRGWLGGPLAEAGLPLADTPWLLLYGNLFFNLCLVLRAGVEALERVSAAQLSAARSLGATPWRAFWRVEWPALLPALASALCLVFLYCFAGFGLALVLGGQRYATAEVEIYTLVAHELALGHASVLAVWMLALTGAVALAYAALQRRLAAPGRVVPLPRQRPRGAAQWLALAGALALLLLVCAAPLLAILWRALQALLDGAAAALWHDGETLPALWNTLRFSALALALSTVLGLAHAFGVRALEARALSRPASKGGAPGARQASAGRSLGRRQTGAAGGAFALAWRAAAYAPFVVSPVTVAFGLLLLVPELSASLALLLAAYALLAYPFIAQSLMVALDSLPAHYEQAAASLGARPWRVFRRVTLPLVAPALRRGMAFAAASALGEFAVTLFLSRPEWTTLTTLIYQRLGRPGAANLDAALLLACLLMALALLAFRLIEGRSHAAPARHA